MARLVGIDIRATHVRVALLQTHYRKIEMLVCHASQRDWLRAHHGMDEYVDAMKRFSGDRGQQIGVQYAEAFVQHRGHPFPQTDLLANLFG